MAMSMTIGTWGVVWGTLQLINVVEAGFYPLGSWREIHQGDSTVMEVPLVVLGSANLASYWLFWWGIPGAAYMFFLLFGTSSDIFLEYKRFWIWFRTTVLGQRLPEEEQPMPTLPSG
jgi:Pheromone A receptor